MNIENIIRRLKKLAWIPVCNDASNALALQMRRIAELERTQMERDRVALKMASTLHRMAGKLGLLCGTDITTDVESALDTLLQNETPH